MTRHFLTITDISREELLLLLEMGLSLKNGKDPAGTRPLEGKSLLLLFYKPSTRTRVSFQAGMNQLGGLAIELQSQVTQITRGESIRDTARVFSRYADGVVIRTFSQEELVEWAGNAEIPIINGLTDRFHPCQILADIMTIREVKGKLKGLKVVYVGDGNNVLNSWIKAACLADFDLIMSCPEGFDPDPEVLAEAQKTGFLGSTPRLVRNPREAVEGADVVYTDVWTSMGQEGNRQDRVDAFKNYQLNKSLISRAAEDVSVMHCLPAHYGEEITEDVMEGPHSIVFDQAENRLHMQKALLLYLMMPDRTVFNDLNTGTLI